MMTESEAKQRWCPFVRFKSRDSGSAPAHNRDAMLPEFGVGDPGFACIGSRCMAWHTASAKQDKEDPGHIEVKGRCGAFSE